MKMKNMRPHIGIFGRRNVGKSSFINAITGEDIAIVSSQAGTTTDPVDKSIELGALGPVVIIDTAGIDDEGEIGEKRITATKKVIDKIDFAILLISSGVFKDFEKDLVEKFKKQNIPFIMINNKSDLYKLSSTDKEKLSPVADVFDFNSINPNNTNEITNEIAKKMPESSFQNPSILGDIINKNDIILLVAPIDLEAPMGRLILPQVQTIRDILDNDAIVIALKETELEYFFKNIKIKPKLVITDSQVFGKVDKIVPKNINLTSFSILFSRIKGDFNEYAKGVRKISELKDGDKVLILEACSHHVNEDDIGRVKLPKWISAFTGKKLEFKVLAGLDALQNVNDYALVIQCGGCMLTRKQILNRVQSASKSKVPVTNYGMAIAYINGIFERATEIFTK